MGNYTEVYVLGAAIVFKELDADPQNLSLFVNFVKYRHVFHMNSSR